jgi:hypothetical protein
MLEQTAAAVKDREQAQTDYAQAQAEFARAELRLRATGASFDQKDEALLLSLKAPVSGSIIDLQIAPGAVLNEATAAVRCRGHTLIFDRAESSVNRLMRSALPGRPAPRASQRPRPLRPLPFQRYATCRSTNGRRTEVSRYRHGPHTVIHRRYRRVECLDPEMRPSVVAGRQRVCSPRSFNHLPKSVTQQWLEQDRVLPSVPLNLFFHAPSFGCVMV